MAVTGFERSRVIHLTCNCCSGWSGGIKLVPEFGSDWYFVTRVDAQGVEETAGSAVPLRTAKLAAADLHDRDKAAKSAA